MFGSKEDSCDAEDSDHEELSEPAPAQVSQSQQPPTAKLFLRHGVDINTNMGEGFWSLSRAW